MRWASLDLPGREALAAQLSAAVERDSAPDALPDSGEVWPVGDLPSLLWDTRGERRFNLGAAPDRAAALALLREAEAEELARPRAVSWRAAFWALADELLRGRRFAVLCDTAQLSAQLLSASRPLR